MHWWSNDKRHSIQAGGSRVKVNFLVGQALCGREQGLDDNPNVPLERQEVISRERMVRAWLYITSSNTNHRCRRKNAAQHEGAAHEEAIFLEQGRIYRGAEGAPAPLLPKTPWKIEVRRREKKRKERREEEERGGWRKKKGDEPPQRANPGSVTDYIIERKKYLFSVFHFYSESEES